VSPFASPPNRVIHRHLQGSSGSWFTSGPGNAIDAISVASSDNTVVPLQSVTVAGVTHAPIVYFDVRLHFARRDRVLTLIHRPSLFRSMVLSRFMLFPTIPPSSMMHAILCPHLLQTFPHLWSSSDAEPVPLYTLIDSFNPYV
jgi:hypothetical protein